MDITSNYHGGNADSLAAGQQNKRAAAHQRARIMDYARRQPNGITCDEAEVALGMSHQSCSARCSELKRDAELVPTDQTRLTRLGSDARVLIAGT